MMDGILHLNKNRQMNNYQFPDLVPGLTEAFEITVTAEMLDEFRNLTGDINPLHCDEAFAKEKGYPSRVCYGMLTASLLSTLGGVYLPGKNCLIHSVEAKFVRPVYIGDLLTVSGTVSEVYDTVRQAVLKVTVINQRKEKVLRGILKVGVLDEG